MDYEDPVFTKYMKIFSRTISVVGTSGAVNMFPVVRYLPGDMFRIKQLKRDIQYLNSEYERMIDEHKQAAKEGKQREDFISAYLKKMDEENGSFFSERQLIGICSDLFGAGTETTSTTLTWAIIYMSLNPDVQEQVHAEIDNVIGCEVTPAMHHRSQLPYTEACILETQRLGDLVPLGVPHAVTEDVYFRGYFIPKRTMVMPNMYGVHMNADVWPEPEKFNPERFLDRNGKVDKKELIPFSLGKRICLGESLARMELFLYFVSMMQHFRFRIAPGHPLPITKGILGITNAPKPFHVTVEIRDKQ